MKHILLAICAVLGGMLLTGAATPDPTVANFPAISTAAPTGGTASPWKIGINGSAPRVEVGGNGFDVYGTNITTLNIGTINLTNPFAPPSFTVANLPASTAGATAWATDVLTPWGTGGTVYYDGSTWRNIASKIAATTSGEQFLRNCLAVGWEGKTPITWGRMADFLGAAGYNDNWMSGTVSGTGASISSVYYSSPEDPGGIGLLTGTTAGGYNLLGGSILKFPANAKMILAVHCALNQALPDGTDNYWTQIGMEQNSSGTNYSAESICFFYDPYGVKTNSLGVAVPLTNNWQCLTRAASTSTVTDSGVTASTSWIDLTIDYNYTNVVFYINGSIVATHTSNISTTGGIVSPSIKMVKAGGTTSRWLALDWIYQGYRYAAARTFQ